MTGLLSVNMNILSFDILWYQINTTVVFINIMSPLVVSINRVVQLFWNDSTSEFRAQSVSIIKYLDDFICLVQTIIIL